MNKINIILGTMTFGPQVDVQTGQMMVTRFLETGHTELDTAHVYNEGETEKILGTIFKDNRNHSLSVASKVNPRITGKLDGPSITMQLNESLRRMGRNSIDLLYLHVPDPQTPIEETLETCAILHKQGKIRELGLSNFPSWMVVDIWYLCKENGWPKPSVYQGLYNGLSRNVESELFPALRKFGIRFYAYNPLAGGMLTGKHVDFDNNPIPGRFARLQSYRNRYWKKKYFDTISLLNKACYDTEIDLTEAALRWLMNHSHLKGSSGDGIILGASSMDQLEYNLAAFDKGDLPETVINAFNEAWEEVRPDSPEYFYFYSR